MGGKRGSKCGGSEGAAGGPPSLLPANSCSCLLSSLRHLRPLQLRHHPPSEHRGRRVDDVSSPATVLPGGAGGVWTAGHHAGLPLLPTLPCPLALIFLRAGPGGRSPRPLLGLGPGSQMSPECPLSEALQALRPLPRAWPAGSRGPSGLLLPGWPDPDGREGGGAWELAGAPLATREPPSARERWGLAWENSGRGRGLPERGGGLCRPEAAAETGRPGRGRVGA